MNAVMITHDNNSPDEKKNLYKKMQPQELLHNLNHPVNII